MCIYATHATHDPCDPLTTGCHSRSLSVRCSASPSRRRCPPHFWSFCGGGAAGSIGGATCCRWFPGLRWRPSQARSRSGSSTRSSAREARISRCQLSSGCCSPVESSGSISPSCCGRRDSISSTRAGPSTRQLRGSTYFRSRPWRWPLRSAFSHGRIPPSRRLRRPLRRAGAGLSRDICSSSVRWSPSWDS